MKLHKFRIKNYKSIKDSGDCYPSNLVTILAGKNESGKTSILEALRDFDTKIKIPASALPITKEELVTEISLTFNADKITINDIYGELNTSIKINTDIQVDVIKHAPNIYSLSDKTKKQLKFFDEERDFKLKQAFDQSYQELNELIEKYPPIKEGLIEYDLNDLTAFGNFLQQYEKQSKPHLNLFTDEDEKARFLTLLTALASQTKELNAIFNIEKKFLDQLKLYIPNFILFNSFDDIFPNKIPLNEIKENEWIKDLSKISDLDPDTINSDNPRRKEQHLDAINLKLNDHYKQFWTQDISKLHVKWDSENLYFWFKEDGLPYEPSIRSKGRQWHLAFYIKVTARSKDDEPNIILIDEPGLFLHAKAQRNILDNLESCAKETQVIFSTHSPYLIEPTKIERVRLVQKNKKDGTQILNKVHAHADKETLTPILTAIGLELNNGIQQIGHLKNVIVEGPSDVFYLQALSGILDKNKDINFIYGGGAGNMPFVGTILIGWGCNVLYLYDNDNGKKNGSKNLIDNWLITKDLIETVTDKKGAIEDLFSIDDFKKYVLDNSKSNYTIPNSEYLKKSNKDKVLISRLFHQLCQTEKIELDEETIERFEKLFKKINKFFN